MDYHACPVNLSYGEEKRAKHEIVQGAILNVLTYLEKLKIYKVYKVFYFRNFMDFTAFNSINLPFSKHKIKTKKYLNFETVFQITTR